MSTDTDTISPSSIGRPGSRLALRMAWIGVQLILVYCLADEFQPFFYQAF